MLLFLMFVLALMRINERRLSRSPRGFSWERLERKVECLRKFIVEKVKPTVISVKVSINAGGINLSLNKSTPAGATSFRLGMR